MCKRNIKKIYLYILYKKCLCIVSKVNSLIHILKTFECYVSWALAYMARADSIHAIRCAQNDNFLKVLQV